jgi:23S rRNA G2445 N2-methylase RlmL
MKIIAFCCLGIEDVLSEDIRLLLGKKAEIRKGACIFNANEKETAKFAYMCQSTEKVGELLKEGEIKENPNSVETTGISFEGKRYSVSCKIIGEKPYKSNEVADFVASGIKANTGKEFTYKQEDIRYHVQIIDDQYYLISDLCSSDLSKRDYKIFVNKSSLRGTIAYALSRIADVKEKDLILDPFCRSGEIPLEIMHTFLQKSVHFYKKDKFMLKNRGWKIQLEDFDKEKEGKFIVNATDSNMANLKAAEKNSKIAGINKEIRFSRMPVEDLDLKFRHELDKIVTQLPALGKYSEKKVMDVYRSFFEICKKIMKKEGIIACIGLHIEKAKEIASQNGYKINHERNIMQGKEELKIYLFENN